MLLADSYEHSEGAYRLHLQDYNTLHVVTFQKTAIFIFTAMRTKPQNMLKG
jgi:hypothetical protein